MEQRTRRTWLMTRVAALLTATALATGVGLAATATGAYAACMGSTCNGDTPSSQGCAPGSARMSRTTGGNLTISLRVNVIYCGYAHWTRLVYDGNYPNPPVRFNFRVQHQKWVGSPTFAWVTAYTQSRTTNGEAGTWDTRMVAGVNNAPARFRSCNRSSTRLIDGWSAWSSWWCSEWFYSSV